MEFQGKKQQVFGVELIVAAPRRAPRGARTSGAGRMYKVKVPSGLVYEIHGGSPGLGGCGSGFEVRSHTESLFPMRIHGKFNTLKAALRYVAGKEAV